MAIQRKATQHGSTKRIIPDDALHNVEGLEEGPAKAQEEGQLAVDVFQTPEHIVIVAPLAGVRLRDVSVSVNKEVLTIRGQRSFNFGVAPENYFTQECFWGTFSRSVILPESVDAGAITASFHDAILTVKVPKVEKIRMRTISIQTD